MVKKPGGQTMSKYNVMNVGGYKAVVKYDPEIEMFRGEFVGLNGGADFYADDTGGLKLGNHSKSFLILAENVVSSPQNSFRVDLTFVFLHRCMSVWPSPQNQKGLV